jgi:hypothetical protein
MVVVLVMVQYMGDTRCRVADILDDANVICGAWIWSCKSCDREEVTKKKRPLHCRNVLVNKFDDTGLF